jgi:hypothetical protein
MTLLTRTRSKSLQESWTQRLTSARPGAGAVMQQVLAWRPIEDNLTDLQSRRFDNRRSRRQMRKLIAFDDDTSDKLKQLARDRMATIQELADEAFADLLRKHGIPVDLKDALRKSASLADIRGKTGATSKASRKTDHKNKS